MNGRAFIHGKLSARSYHPLHLCHPSATRSSGSAVSSAADVAAAGNRLQKKPPDTN